MYEDDKLKLIYLAREAEDYELSRDGFGSFSFLVSAKDNILMTPKDINRFDLRPDDIIVISRTGEEVENIKGNKWPADTEFHLVSYDERDDSIDTVMHINPPNASLRADESHRIIFLSDCIDPADSETGDIAQLIKNPIKHRDCMLIKGNGILIVGEGIFESLDKAKYIEEIAKIKMPKDQIHDYEHIQNIQEKNSKL